MMEHTLKETIDVITAMRIELVQYGSGDVRCVYTAPEGMLDLGGRKRCAPININTACSDTQFAIGAFFKKPEDKYFLTYVDDVLFFFPCFGAHVLVMKSADENVAGDIYAFCNGMLLPLNLQTADKKYSENGPVVIRGYSAQNSRWKRHAMSVAPDNNYPPLCKVQAKPIEISDYDVFLMEANDHVSIQRDIDALSGAVTHEAITEEEQELLFQQMIKQLNG
ncbi:hypothetical protein RI537_12395 [Aeromonas salmonicida]|uniref:hypothetical protein n=1 Tax=Aeromonas salmonicida TaxID=645 RepID=UPI00343A07B9